MKPALEPVLDKMRADWDARAASDARHHIRTHPGPQSGRDFFRSGEINIANDLMPEMFRICGGTRSPLDLQVLEIGCGIGRMTRMMATIFGHVTGIDISPEMIRQARENLAGLPNVALLEGDGCTLRPLPNDRFDFAFSFIVFQHIPALEIVESYFHEVWRVLKPNSLFKVQLQGRVDVAYDPHDSWVGVPVSYEQACQLVEATGFVLEAVSGAGSQFFWLNLRKPGKTLRDLWASRHALSPKLPV